MENYQPDIVPFEYPDTRRMGTTIVPQRMHENMKPYSPPVPCPPVIDETDSRTWEAYGQYHASLNSGSDRMMSPRMGAVVSEVKDLCQGALQEKRGPTRKDMISKAIVLNDSLMSTWERQHSEEKGTARYLYYAHQANAERRLIPHYGDYYSEFCQELRQLRPPDGPPLKWNQVLTYVDAHGKTTERKPDWREVWDNLNLEMNQEKEEEKYRTRPMIHKPWLASAQKAADMLYRKRPEVTWAIRLYAARNEMCHSGLGNLIRDKHFEELAEKIGWDKRTIIDIYGDGPGCGRGCSNEIYYTKRCVEFVEHKYFEYCRGRKDKKLRPEFEPRTPGP